MAIRGPSAALLAHRIEAIRTPAGQAQLGQEVTRRLQLQLRAQFFRSTDAYGAPLAPLKHGSGRPLWGSGRFHDSFKLVLTSSGVRLETPVRPEIVRAHQQGAVVPARQAGGQELLFSPRSGKLLRESRAKRLKLVYVSTARQHLVGSFVLDKRQMVPEAATGGVGPVWGGVLNDAAREWMRRLVRDK